MARTIIHKKGRHLASPLYIPRIWLFKKPKGVGYRIIFDDTAEYYHPNGYGGINKLFGVDFTPITPGNKGWSYMIGWVWEVDRINIYWYVNKPDGTHESGLIGSVAKKQEADYYIYFGDDNSVRFLFNDLKEWNAHKHSNGKTNKVFSREIRPTFGGIYAAPHDVRLVMEQIAIDLV